MDKRTYNRMVVANFYSRQQQPDSSPHEEVRHDLVRYAEITSPKTTRGLITALQNLPHPFRVLEGIDGTGNYYVEYPNWNPNDPARIDYHAQLFGGLLPHGITINLPVSTLTLSYRECLNVSSVHNLDPPLDMFRHTDSKIYIEFPDNTTTPNTKMTSKDVEDYMGKKGIRLGPILHSLP